MAPTPATGNHAEGGPVPAHAAFGVEAEFGRPAKPRRRNFAGGGKPPLKRPQGDIFNRIRLKRIRLNPVGFAAVII
jgi:hypothetical protein